MRILSCIDNISEWSGRIVSFLILFMIAIIDFEVVARYVFNHPTLWAQESAQFIFGAGAVLAGAYVLRHEAHVRMDVLYSRFSPRGKAILDIIVAPLFFAFCIILVWKGWALAWSSVQWLERSSSQWRPPIYPVKMTIPVAAFLLFLQGLANFIRNLITLFARKDNLS